MIFLNHNIKILPDITLNSNNALYYFLASCKKSESFNERFLRKFRKTFSNYQSCHYFSLEACNFMQNFRVRYPAVFDIFKDEPWATNGRTTDRRTKDKFDYYLKKHYFSHINLRDTLSCRILSISPIISAEFLFKVRHLQKLVPQIFFQKFFFIKTQY